MKVKVSEPVYINFVHLIKNKDTDEPKKWTFRIWLGKTGFGESKKDRFVEGVCYEVDKNLKQEEWTAKTTGKVFYKAKLYNTTWEVMKYDSPKTKTEKELWVLKKWDETANKPTWNEASGDIVQEDIISDNESVSNNEENGIEELGWINENN